MKSMEEKYKEHSEAFNCSHDKTEIRERTIKGGSKQYVHQCLQCGETASNPIKRAEVSAIMGGVIRISDETLKARYATDRAESLKSIKITGDQEWWTWYSDYLTTDEWRLKREIIFLRANGTCEGCLSERATQVHHLTYKHAGDELLFELVAICDGCHEKVHKEPTE